MSNSNGETTPTKKKKLTISEFKVKPKIPESFEKESWKKLSEAINAIFRKEIISFSQEELFKCVQDLCIHQKSAELYQNLSQECLKNVQLFLEPLLNQTTDTTAYLGMIVKTWEDFSSEFILIGNIFLYLDRTYVINAQLESRSIWELGLSQFRSTIALNPKVKSKYEKGFMELLKLERNGDVIDRMILKKISQMLISLSIYEPFEKIILQETDLFYLQEAKTLFQQMNINEFLLHIEKRIRQENERSDTLLAGNSKKLILKIVDQQLIKGFADKILERGFEDAIVMNKLDDLTRMYKLFDRVQYLKELFNHFNNFIKKHGTNIINLEDEKKNLVQEILKFKQNMDSIYKGCFNSNQNYLFDYKLAFEKFINIDSGKVAECIAKYIDSNLKSGKGVTTTEMEQIMDDCIIIFKLLDSKDVFEAYYKKDLAKRLLLGKSTSFELEKVMISKLKQECGANYTGKLEGMFKDIDLSRDFMQNFKKTVDTKKFDIDLSVTVITSGLWPPYQVEPLNLPQNIAECQELFKTFYLDKFTGRAIKWQHGLASATVKANFPKGIKELQLSAFQTSVLLLFNDSNQLNFSTIKQLTGIEDKELDKTLQSLSTEQIKIISCQDKDYIYNQDFNHQLIKIKVNQIQIKETVEEKEQTDSKIILDRQYSIDATIVRIMKSRKSLNHNQLMTEVFDQLKFPMKSQDVKKRIESLIERDYLTREKEGPETTYIYQA